MSVDLSGLSFEELKNLASQAESEAKGRKAEEVRAFKARVRKEAEILGLTVSFLTKSGAASKAAAASGKYKYINPNDADGKGYNGRGPKPAWLKEAEQQGRTLEDFINPEF